MAWGPGFFLLLLLLATPGPGQRPPPTPGAPGLRHSYDCGAEGMQLLVLPPQGRTVRFKVMGECLLTQRPRALAAGGLGSSPCRRDRKRRGGRLVPASVSLVPQAASPCQSVHGATWPLRL